MSIYIQISPVPETFDTMPLEALTRRGYMFIITLRSFRSSFLPGKKTMGVCQDTAGGSIESVSMEDDCIDTDDIPGGGLR